MLSAFTGDLLYFLAATFAALEHELAHALTARRLGYALDRIVLMPYGAVLSGDFSGIPPKEEALIAAAGPLCSGLTALGFAALWWLFPETYPYTDAAAHVSFSLFVVNLLPAYPLDGGRILRVLLSRLKEEHARRITRAVSFSVSAAIFSLFVWSCFSRPNFSALAFSLFLFAGNFGGGSYSRVKFRPKRFERGVEEKRIALSAEVTAGQAMRHLREDKYLVFVLFLKGEFAGEVAEEELLAALERGEYAKPLREFLPAEY